MARNELDSVDLGCSVKEMRNFLHYTLYKAQLQIVWLVEEQTPLDRTPSVCYTVNAHVSVHSD